MTKKLSIFLFTIFLHMEANAYEAEINGIFYNFDQTAQTAKVTYRSSKSSSNSSAYSGEVTIPSVVAFNGVTYSVTCIDNEAFKACTNLTSIVIPNSITFIGTQVFAYCRRLSSVTIGNGVTTMGMLIFQGCNNLTAIRCKCPTPPKMDYYIDVFTPFSTTTLYIPRGSLSSYQSKFFWEDFKNIVEE